MKKITTVIIAILVIVLTVVAGTKHSIKKYSDEAEEQAKLASAEAEKAQGGQVLDAPVTTAAGVAAEVADTAEAAQTTADVADGSITAQAAETGNQATTTEEQADVDELAYEEDLSAEDKEAFKEFLEQQPDIDEDFVKEFFANNSWLNYAQDPDGNYLVPLARKSLASTDNDRPRASVLKGLNTLPIDDAISFPFELNESQVAKVKAAGANSTIGFSDEEIDAFRKELFKELLENPVLMEAWMRLVTSQKIGDEYSIQDYWKNGSDYVSEADKARTDGSGMNHWLRKVSGEYYVSPEYQRYAIGLITFLDPRESKAEVLEAKAKNHYHLVVTGVGHSAPNSQRVATPADYAENLASLDFWFRLKNGKVGIKIGANLRDKRPEVLNNTTVKKSAAKKATPSKVTKPDPTPAKNKPDPGVNKNKPDPNPSTNKPDPGVNKNKPDPNPSPKKPDPNPEKKTEKKDPTKDPVVQGNAQTGGGKNDDTGPGPQKPDQGNSKSDKVEESQYQQGNSENTDGNNVTNYDQGPAADYTDGGAVPQTVPIDNTKSQSNDDYVKPAAGGGQSDTPAQAGKNNGKMKTVPSVD